MSGPMEREFAQVREALHATHRAAPSMPLQNKLEDAASALSAIERHVQDMETALRLRFRKGHNDTCSALLSEGCACDCGMVETISALAALPAREKGTE